LFPLLGALSPPPLRMFAAPSLRPFLPVLNQAWSEDTAPTSNGFLRCLLTSSPPQARSPNIPCLILLAGVNSWPSQLFLQMCSFPHNLIPLFFGPPQSGSILLMKVGTLVAPPNKPLRPRPAFTPLRKICPQPGSHFRTYDVFHAIPPPFGSAPNLLFFFPFIFV